MHLLFETMLSAIRSGQPFALGIITGVKGSSPQKKGAKALFFPDGRIVGTMGGGCLEAEIRERARHALLEREPAGFDLVLDHDFGWDDGLICGGKVFGVILPAAAEAGHVWRELALRKKPLVWGVRKDFTIGWDDGTDEWLYRERVSPPFSLWLAGSGHVAQAVAPLAQQVDFEVTVFDDRPALANHQYFPPATRLRVDAWDKLLSGAPASAPPTFGVILTRGHQHDALVLRHWIQQPFAFLGMIGSGRKRRLIFSEFIEEGLATEEQLNRIACPVGTAIGAVSVPEIAVSIVGQLIQERVRVLKAGEPSASAVASVMV